ncbi:B-cell receptor CD22-like [Alosa sapidissima]|uniref:B-cell receptor CD22-like n=1 Tax=Alosa sapidissima TaxID=34773 RepID=UPI001C08ADEA|nr:B-cell receptor CD22-like [Alosa sapidissima]
MVQSAVSVHLVLTLSLIRVAKVFWAKDPQPDTERTDLSDDPEYKSRMLYSGNKNCTMTLKDMKLADAGFYHPRIVTDNAKEKWLGQPGLHLFITELSVWIPRPVVEGSEVKMRCNNSCSPAQKPTVIWRKNGVDVSGQQTKHDQLILGRVSVEDEGNYSCALKGFEGHPSKPVKLNTMFSPKNTIVYIMPADRIVKGRYVTLTCSSDANPPVQSYTWLKVNESTPVGSGQQYSITNISSEDEGLYYCEASNKYGAENSTVITITVEVDNTLMIYIVIGVSSGCGFLGLLCAGCFIRVRCRAEKSENTSRPSPHKMKPEESNRTDDCDYEDCTFDNTTDMDCVYQNFNPNTHGYDDDDEVYQNV